MKGPGTAARASLQQVLVLLGAACALLACEQPSAQQQPLPGRADLVLLLSLAEKAGLTGLEGSAHPCSGGASGVALSGRGAFDSATSFVEALGRLPTPAHAAVVELLAPEGGGLALSVRICPGNGPRPGALLLALSEVIPDGAFLTGLSAQGDHARIEGRAASKEVALQLAAALRARPEVSAVEVKALGMEGERHTFLLEAELAPLGPAAQPHR